MNRAILIGRLTSDPKTSTTGNSSVTRLSIAVDRKFKQDGQPTADFINCVAFGKTAENLAKFFAKGNRIAIEGHIQTGSYTNKDGIKVNTTDVVVDGFDFIESRNTSAPAQKPGNDFVDIPSNVDDEIPFS